MRLDLCMCVCVSRCVNLGMCTRTSGHLCVSGHPGRAGVGEHVCIWVWNPPTGLDAPMDSLMSVGGL